MSHHSTHQSSFLQLRLHYISIILFLLICNGCKSDCEKAAAFSATDYDTMSEAFDHKAIVDMKCKNEIDAMNLDEKTAAQKYCDYTKNCSTINRIIREEERIAKEKKEEERIAKEKEEEERIAKEKKEEERQAKLNALFAEIKQKCPTESDNVLFLAKELTTDQRRECYDLVMKLNSLSELIYKSSYLNIPFIYWMADTMVYDISRMNLFSETRNKGVMIGGPIRYLFVNDKANNNIFAIMIDIDNRSDLPVLISKDDVSFYINGRKASDSDITTDFSFMQKIDSCEEDIVIFLLKLPNGYQTYEDLLSIKLKVYFNHDSIGKARLFPTAGPLNANDDIMESSNALYTLHWHHAKNIHPTIG